MRFEQDSNNYYYMGYPDFKTEELLKNIGFHYDHREFDEYGNTVEVWTKIKSMSRFNKIGKIKLEK